MEETSLVQESALIYQVDGDLGSGFAAPEIPTDASEDVHQMASDIFGFNSDPNITPRQRAWVELVYSGVHPTDAARRVGYKAPTVSAHQLKHSPSMRSYMEKILELAGVSDMALAHTVRNALGATRAVEVVVTEEQPEDTTEGKPSRFKAKKKQVIREEDHYARLQAADMAFKLKGRYPEKTSTVKLEGSIDIRNAPQVTIQMLSLEGGDLIKEMMSRSRQIANGTLPREMIDPDEGEKE